MLVTTINGGQGMRAIYSEEIKEMFENLYEWDDDLFNEIINELQSCLQNSPGYIGSVNMYFSSFYVAFDFDLV